MTKQQEKFNQQQHTSNSSYKEQTQGRTSSKKEELGDYVDYEEVD